MAFRQIKPRIPLRENNGNWKRIRPEIPAFYRDGRIGKAEQSGIQLTDGYPVNIPPDTKKLKFIWLLQRPNGRRLLAVTVAHEQPSGSFPRPLSFVKSLLLEIGERPRGSCIPSASGCVRLAAKKSPSGRLNEVRRRVASDAEGLGADGTKCLPSADLNAIFGQTCATSC